jgi:isocitrate dehydrogenase
MLSKTIRKPPSTARQKLLLVFTRSPYHLQNGSPSVVGGDDNLIVYRVNCGRKALCLKNEREVIDQVRRIAGRHK